LKQKLDKGEELLYKSFELDPLAKMSVELGKDATKRILNRLEYLAGLTLPRNLSWLGVNRNIQLLDPETALLVRDHSIFSNVRRIADHGVAHQYGQVLLSGGHAPESLIAAASEIAHVDKDENEHLSIYRKKQFGLENKHGKELISEFHDMTPSIKQQKEKKEKDDIEDIDDGDFVPPWLEEDREVAVMKHVMEQQSIPPLKKEEEKPPLKKDISEVKEDELYSPPWG